MKAVNVHNLKRLKRALQIQKLKRIDSYRMQVCCSELNQRPKKLDVSGFPDLVKDHNGQFMIIAYDANGRQYRKPFRLLSNSAQTILEMSAVQREIPLTQLQGGAGQAATSNPDPSEKKEIEQFQADATSQQDNKPSEFDGEAAAGDSNKMQDEEQKEDGKPKGGSEAQSNLEEEEPAGNTIQQQEIIVKVENIEIRDKTDTVIQKLIKINKLFDDQRNLSKQKEDLMRFKIMFASQVRRNSGNDAFKDKSSQCRKVSHRLKLCSKLHKSGQQSEARNAAKPAIDELKCSMQGVDSLLGRGDVFKQQQATMLFQHQQQQIASLQMQRLMLHQSMQAKSRQNSNTIFEFQPPGGM